jgi:hypothetical protein
MEHTGAEGGWVASQNIITYDKEVDSHKRHLLQQSCYSICTAGEKEDAYYCCHEDVFSRGSKRQDFLWKFTLPINEQRYIVQKLESQKITAYSLFGSEESLMETEFLREFFLKQT